MKTHSRTLVLMCLAASLLSIAACRFNHGDVMRDVRPMAINGEVQGIDLSDGLKVRLKDENKYYVLSDYCNGNTCLKDQITFKDSLRKNIGSDTVYLIKKYTGTVSVWKLRMVK